jgi:hypothetical protein
MREIRFAFSLLSAALTQKRFYQRVFMVFST